MTLTALFQSEYALQYFQQPRKNRIEKSVFFKIFKQKIDFGRPFQWKMSQNHRKIQWESQKTLILRYWMSQNLRSNVSDLSRKNRMKKVFFKIFKPKIDNNFFILKGYLAFSENSPSKTVLTTAPGGAYGLKLFYKVFTVYIWRLLSLRKFVCWTTRNCSSNNMIPNQKMYSKTS